MAKSPRAITAPNALPAAVCKTEQQPPSAVNGASQAYPVHHRLFIDGGGFPLMDAPIWAIRALRTRPQGAVAGSTPGTARRRRGCRFSEGGGTMEHI